MNSFNEHFKHLSKDPVLKYLIEKIGDKIRLSDRYEKDLAKAVSQIIIEQQVSFKAAITIKKRFNNLIGKLSYKNIQEIDNKDLQSIGISFKKVEYIKNVYLYFLNNKLDFKILDNEEVINELTKIKGVGKWTAEMFLIFSLNRIDVLPLGDLGLKAGIKKIYNMRGLPSPKRMLALSNIQLTSIIESLTRLKKMRS